MELCSGLFSQGPLNDLEILQDFYMPFDYTTLGAVDTPERAQNWTDTLEAIMQMNPDAVAICDYGYGSDYAMTYWKEHNYLPKAVLLSTLYLPFSDPTMLDFVTTTASYSSQAKFPTQYNFTDSIGYNQLVMNRYGEPANQEVARATLSGMVFTNAILQSESNSSDAINNAFATSQFASFMGTSAFDASHRQTLTELVIQLLENGTISNVIGPAQAAADAYIYPMPTWNERIFNPKWGSGVEIAGVVLMVLGGIITLFWAGFLFLHWKHKVIVAASPLFCLTILIGSMMVFISIFNWMPNLITDSVCNLRVWLLPLGFMTMFGALIAKTDRIHRLYNTRGISIIVISNTQVALIILIIVVIQAAISILMITVTDLQANLFVVDQYRVSNNYWVCSFSKPLKVLFGINVGYAAILLGWGTYLAYRIRRVPISIFDESKVIGFSIYNTAFFGAIVIVIQLAIGNNNRNVTFMITAVCCFLGAVITISCLFAAKWFAIYQPDSRRGVVTSVNLTSSSDQSHHTSKDSASSNVSVDANGKKYKEKIKTLKQQVSNLKERIRQLESLAKNNGFLNQDEEEMTTDGT